MTPTSCNRWPIRTFGTSTAQLKMKQVTENKIFEENLNTIDVNFSGGVKYFIEELIKKKKFYI